MLYFLSGLNLVLLFLVLYLFFVGVSVAGFYLTRKIHVQTFVKGDEISSVGPVITVLGTLFALLLGLILVSVWQSFQEYEVRAVEEAVILGNIYRDSGVFRSEDSVEIREKVKNYTKSLLYDGWPRLVHGQESEKAWKSFNAL